MGCLGLPIDVTPLCENSSVCHASRGGDADGRYGNRTAQAAPGYLRLVIREWLIVGFTASVPESVATKGVAPVAWLDVALFGFVRVGQIGDP